MTPPVVGPDGALPAELREKCGIWIEDWRWYGSGETVLGCIIEALVRAGWRDLTAVRDADQAQADHGRTFAADACQRCGHPLSVHHVYGLCAGCSR